mgnify:CR=1 FL=1|tara:strand:+ start:6273 stop:6824 length:552 start_codon:yes stop_codon:yes gene_type:complete
MKETFFELLAYLKNPVLEQDSNTDFKYRISRFFHMLIFCLAVGLLIAPIFTLIEEFGWVNMDDHAMEDMMQQFSKPMVFFFAVILAPFFEELFFRSPLTLFKNVKHFKIAFYIFAVLFGLIHITNFKITTNVLLLTPILVAPQTILGGILGFIRVKFGLIWSMALHGFYNGILMLIAFSAESF